MPGRVLINPAGAEEFVDAAGLSKALSSGYKERAGEGGTLVAPTAGGVSVSATPEQLAELEALRGPANVTSGSGQEFDRTRARTKQVQEDARGSGAETVLAGGASALDSFTLGGSSKLAELGGADLEELQAVKEAHPTVSAVSGIGGDVAAALLSGGTSLLGRTAALTVPGMIAKAGAAVGKLGGKSKVAANVLTGIAEGSLYSGAQGFRNILLSEDKEFTAEAVIGELGPDMLFSGALGGGVGFAASALSKAASAIGKRAKVSPAGLVNEGEVAAAYNGVRSNFDDIAASLEGRAAKEHLDQLSGLGKKAPVSSSSDDLIKANAKAGEIRSAEELAEMKKVLSPEAYEAVARQNFNKTGGFKKPAKAPAPGSTALDDLGKIYDDPAFHRGAEFQKLGRDKVIREVLPPNVFQKLSDDFTELRRSLPPSTGDLSKLSAGKFERFAKKYDDLLDQADAAGLTLPKFEIGTVRPGLKTSDALGLAEEAGITGYLPKQVATQDLMGAWALGRVGRKTAAETSEKSSKGLIDKGADFLKGMNFSKGLVGTVASLSLGLGGVAKALAGKVAFEKGAALAGKAGAARGVKGAIASRLQNLSFDGSPSPKDEKPAQTMRRHAEALQKAVSNPKPLLKKIPALAPLAVGAPEIAQQVEQAVQARLAYLFEKVPKPPTANPLAPSRWQPSDVDISRFQRYVDAAFNPSKFIDELKTGRVTPETAETLRTLHKGTYRQLQKALIEEAPNLQDAPYEMKINLSILFRVPVDDTMKPGFITRMQANFAQANAEKPGPEPSEDYSAIGSGLAAQPTMAQTVGAGI